ncbi:MAG TPA: serine/threonine-protein kinase [Polyangiaceae bacterium]|nr:serine/threonine-protein kinase [Polyangiaceae bacterium]
MSRARHTVGTILDRRYLLKREVARGAAGVVYEAQHLFTKRPVAVKLLSETYAHVAETRNRLLREAIALATARHPFVAQVLDAGELPEFGPYLVMELLEGRTLQGILAVRLRIGVHETVQVGRQLCEALAVAHGRGVLHRDIKPSNIFVARDETGREVVKLIDFGIARTTSDSNKLTQQGAVLGTPEYMAPEQMMGHGQMDERVDIYAVGVTLYECLTGNVPFDGSFGEVLLKSSTQEIPPIRAKSPTVPAELAATIEKALARDPNDRYPSMSAFVESLTQFPVPDTGATLLGLRALRPVARPAPVAPKLPAAAPPELPGVARRRFPRAPYVTPTRILRPTGKGIDGRSEDISVAGLLVVTAAPCDADELVKVRFALPGSGKLVELAARTKWVRNARGTEAVGLEFTAVPPDVHTAIEGYVTSMVGL